LFDQARTLIFEAMPASALYRPDSRFLELGEGYSDTVRPAEFPAAVLRFRNDRIAARIGLDGLTDEEWIRAFARFEPLPGALAEPLALRYHGHQFRIYNAELGDGRGFLYAQVREAGSERLLDLGTKGSGRTPWSRGGDGRLTLKGGVREVLATEMLEALGVPTSKSFSLIETGEALERGDEPSPTRSSVLVRLSFSHIRFGTFQRLAYFDRADLIERLTGFVAHSYFPELNGHAGAALAPALLSAVVGRSARLAARWTAAGFVHGVLNSDNMNITGESFDYGPYRFLPLYDPMFTAAYFDHVGLYAFGRQPEAVFWNLTQLAGCLAMTSETEPLVEALNGFGPTYQSELAQAFVRRLGVTPREPEADAALAQATLALLREGGRDLRWEPLFFDWFCGEASERRAMAGPRAGLYAGPVFDAFRQALHPYSPDRPERLEATYFSRPEPQELIWDEIEALWASIAEGDDWAPLCAKLARIGEAREAWGIAEP
jgi:uncharacterized protein YdiU (UPF0061 family)